MNPRKALTIAGSDSGGGAGIQADLKTFSALGVYGASVITAITAQNTVGVTAIMDVTTDVISRQIEAVLTDVKPQAVKTGMLSNADIIQTVSDGLRKYSVKKLVVDPVMVAKSGDRLLQDNAISALIERLLPQAMVLTPNIPEAEVLTGKKITTISDMEIAADTLRAMGPKYIIVKGGHLKGEAIDVFYDGRKIYHLRHQRIRSKNTHGTGCTFSAAITAHLAKGFTVLESVRLAKRYISLAITHAFSVGSGHGPVHHFHKFY